MFYTHRKLNMNVLDNRMMNKVIGINIVLASILIIVENNGAVLSYWNSSPLLFSSSRITRRLKIMQAVEEALSLELERCLAIKLGLLIRLFHDLFKHLNRIKDLGEAILTSFAPPYLPKICQTLLPFLSCSNLLLLFFLLFYMFSVCH